MGRNRVSEEWKSIRKKLNDDEFRYFERAMTVMYTDGFKAGYEMASQEKWILAEGKQPQTDEVVKEIKKLPSAQTTQTDTSNTLKALDCVERQAAIDAVSRGCQEFRGIFAECEKNLNELPPAQPVHNTGKWVRGTCYGLGIYNWTCKCGHVIAAKVPDRFCGACGCDNAERRTDE